MIKVDHILTRFEQLQEAKKPFLKPFEDCRKYASPYSPPIMGGTEPQGEKSRDNHDSTAELASRNLASVVLTSTTPPDTKWIHFENEDQEGIEDNTEALEYIDEVEYTTTNALNQSNFYMKKYEFEKSRIDYGVGVMFVEEGRGNMDLNFRTIPVSDVYLAEDYQGYVDTVYRSIKMTLRALAQEFTLEELSDQAQSKYETNPYEEVEIIHAVYPRIDDEREMDNEGNFKRDKNNMPFVDVWIEKESQHLIEEGGYRVFPYIVSRWNKESGEVYGHGPVMDSLADIKILNRMTKSMIQLAEKINNPAKAIIGGEKDELDLTPGAVNHLDEETKVEDLISGANYPITDSAVRDKKLAVQDALYVNQFQSIDRRDDKEMTAREVRAIEMETMRVLSPVLGRSQPETIGPLMIRVLDILRANGRLPEEPEGVRLTLKYVNQLSRAQRQDEMNAIRFVIGSAGEIAQFSPEVLDNVNTDEVFKLLTEASGTPAIISRPKREVEKIRTQRAEMQQRQQQLGEAEVKAEVQKDQASAEEKQARAQKYQKEAA